MELLWETLTFWNKKQTLIVKWLEEDYKAFAKIKVLESWKNTEHEKELIYQYRELEKEKNWKDKYIKSLIDIKMHNIIDELVKPILEEKKKYYETSFNLAIHDKRQIALKKLQKKFKWRNCTLDF